MRHPNVARGGGQGKLAVGQFPEACVFRSGLQWVIHIQIVHTSFCQCFTLLSPFYVNCVELFWPCFRAAGPPLCRRCFLVSPFHQEHKAHSQSPVLHAMSDPIGRWKRDRRINTSPRDDGRWPGPCGVLPSFPPLESNAACKPSSTVLAKRTMMVSRRFLLGP